ncbi:MULTISPECIES: DUF2207 domain-containing protein [Lactobacillus]|uniref:DUF2207 domain-containing protein n=1 Tax=Lactobacillus xujianguonis TaxID=2495899 RepID=A0A437SVN8_9LACO|nr:MULTISPECIES: DUF2207 domain-containing protein [Lactobacillus]RVU70994.1 DUF2207 domain-containing protein [Lactobacillus xujianguonis]RVU73936.1 DUF2207 domain-containing protein [Lactobacillus xujianguonis]
MKRITKLITFCTMLISFLIISNQPVKADGPDYDITSVHVKAKVQSNGSLQMERRISYSFNGKAHGVFYSQDLEDYQTLEQPKVAIISKGKTQQIKKSKSNANNTYELEHYSGGDYDFRIYHRIKDGSKLTVVYRYLN